MRLTTEAEQECYTKTYIHDIAGTYDGVLVVCGGGRDMWEDYMRAVQVFEKSKLEKFDIMAVNVAGMFVEGVDHLFSIHHKQIKAIKEFREAEYIGEKFLTHAHIDRDDGLIGWDFVPTGATSGLQAVTLGHLLGYKKIILVGVPLDETGYFYKPAFNPEFPEVRKLDEINNVKHKFGEVVKSMSGRTRDVFGEPDIEWIRS